MSKPCEYNYTDCIEIGQIAALLSESYFETLFQKADLSYIDAAYAIGEWAVEFYDKYRDVNWEDLLENPQSFGLDDRTICWDDAIYQFGQKKLEQIFKKDIYEDYINKKK